MNSTICLCILDKYFVVMASFTPFHCYACLPEFNPYSHESIFQHRSLMFSTKANFVWILKKVCIKLIRYIDPNNREYHYDDDKCQNFHYKELNMGRALVKLLMHHYDKDPNKVYIDDVKNLTDAVRGLKQHLKLKAEIYAKAAENPFTITSGRACYQSFVVDCLFFTVRFMVECMNKFENEKDNFFFHLFSTIYNTFTSEYVIERIAHDIQRMEPFGKVSDDENIKFP